MKKTRTIVALATTLILSLGFCLCGQMTSNAESTSSTSIESCSHNNNKTDKIIIAHRGASGYLPEHTLEAYTMAYAMGADYIEADVNISKDGVPIVMHDIYLDTDTDVATLFPDRCREDGRYYIVDFTLAEIKQLSVSERIDLDTQSAVFDKRFPVGKSHFEVPTLQEEIELIQGLNKSTGRNVGIYPELKFPDFYTENGFDIGKITLDCLDSYGYNNKKAKCYIQCFDAPYLKAFKERLTPKCKLVQLVGDQTWDECKNNDIAYMLSAKGLKDIAKYADVLSPCTDEIYNDDGTMNVGGQVLNSHLVRDAHAAKLEVHPYTVRKEELPSFVNSADEFIRKLLFEAGCDGLFTDFTDIGVQAKHEGPLRK